MVRDGIPLTRVGTIWRSGRCRLLPERGITGLARGGEHLHLLVREEPQLGRSRIPQAAEQAVIVDALAHLRDGLPLGRRMCIAHGLELPIELVRRCRVRAIPSMDLHLGAGVAAYCSLSRRA